MNTAAQTSDPVTTALAHLVQKTQPRAKSLIVSIYGDALLPRGGWVWLGSLISIAKFMDVSDRLVRTSVFRLCEAGWLEKQAAGRRAYYRLSDEGLRTFEEAAARIYAGSRPRWDGHWRMAQILAHVPPEQRSDLRQMLMWQGFGAIGPQSLIHPSISPRAVDRLIARHDAGADVAVMVAAPSEGTTADTLRVLSSEAWPLEELQEGYQQFITLFQPVLEALQQAERTPPGAVALALRVLLIHEYRRVLLADPWLPDILLPRGWVGDRARELAAEIYRVVLGPAERHLDFVLEGLEGDEPVAPASLEARFAA